MSGRAKNVVGVETDPLAMTSGIHPGNIQEIMPHVNLPPQPVKDTRRIVAKPISIYLIYPDPTQPRRVIPAPMREHFPVKGTKDFTPEQMQAFFQRWVDATGIDPAEFLDEEYEAPEYREPLQLAFMEVIRLAMTIRRDKLLNPISVFPHPDLGLAFRIDTGERRWLAFHLLHQLTGDDYWEKIPAQDVGSRDIWRQADENNAREDLTAIGKARQIALLLMDIFGVDQFKSIHHFAHERQFYAQVGDGEQRRIPKGMPERIAQTMGLKKNQVRDYRALLRLPDTAWTLADDARLPESRLRVLVDEAAGNEARLTQLIEEYSVSQDTLPAENSASIDALSAEASTAGQGGTVAAAKNSGGINWSTVFGKIKKTEPTPADLPSLQEMRQWLDEQIARLKKS